MSHLDEDQQSIMHSCGEVGPCQARPSILVTPAPCPLFVELAAKPPAQKTARAKPEPHLCQARHWLQQTAVIAKGRMENFQKTNIPNTCTN